MSVTTYPIVLATVNARYTHASLGLRYLYANMQELQASTHILEFTLNLRAQDIVERLLEPKPRIIGLGVYIWNIELSTQIVAILKSVAPDVIVILGGPEVSYETEEQAIVQQADYVVCGAAEVDFYRLCQQCLAGTKPLNKVHQSTAPPLDQLALPYEYFSDEDLKNRSIYVEASRGCPFKCEFCLSALDKTAYPFELERFLQAMDTLWQRGLRQFRFVDRTFNLKIDTTTRILDFFLQRLDEQTFLHFELIPDRLPDALKERITRFPEGTLQFEIGIQSLNPEVQALISRKQDNHKTQQNLIWLKENTNAHLHTDLIFGLPGESLASFAEGFNQLWALAPHEIQLGILKRLRGTPIIRHTGSHQVVYSPLPPYAILANDHIDFALIQRISRMAHYWDLVANSGYFKLSLPLLLADQPFERFLQWSDWLYEQTQRTDKIALTRLFESVYKGGIDVLAVDADVLGEQLMIDFKRTGQKGRLSFAVNYEHLADRAKVANGVGEYNSRNARQGRHRVV